VGAAADGAANGHQCGVNELWQPSSACGPHCLADDEPFAAVGRARRAGRLAAVTGVMVVAAALLPILPLLPAGRRARLIRGCARGVLRALGIRVIHRGGLPTRRAVPAVSDATGRPSPGGALLVSNHVSWLDIVVLLATERTRLVAKREVGQWPVIGRIARYAGTIFVDRARPRTLPAVVDEVRSALAAGAVVAVFPEGTTSCGRAIGRFRPAFFQAAVDAGAAVVPVTLRFDVPGVGRTSAAAFIGDETVLDSIRRILRLPGLRISLACGAAIHPASGATRRSLARVAATAVGASGPVVDREAERSAPAPVPAPTAPYLVRDQPGPADSRTPPAVLRPAA
jgi:1-acyl-sn-glycerol-3-phosphate acyltransferase